MKSQQLGIDCAPTLAGAAMTKNIGAIAMAMVGSGIIAAAVVAEVGRQKKRRSRA